MDELSAVLTAPGSRYVLERNSIVAARPDLSEIIAARGLRLHGGQLPSSWTSDDLRAEATIALIGLLDALRLHGTALVPVWSRLRLMADELAEVIADRPAPLIDPQRLRVDRIRQYLIQWAAPVTRQAMEEAEEDVTAHRRGLRLSKAITELSTRRGATVGPDEAARWANSRRAETYGIAEATRVPATLAIARASDIDPSRIRDRERTSARLRAKVITTHPEALEDIRALAAFDRSVVADRGLPAPPNRRS